MKSMDESTIRIKCQKCGAHTIANITPGISQSAACSGCGMHLVEFESLRGFIYVLSHPQMPGLVKIGFTTRTVEERVAELSNPTSVPGAFVIEGVFPTGQPEQHELSAHEKFAAARIESKEFFRIDLIEAIRMVSAICGPASYLRKDFLRPEPPKPEPPKPQPPKPQSPKPQPPKPPGPVRPRISKESRFTSEDEAKKLLEWQERMFRR
jgi:hypothetical protein